MWCSKILNVTRNTEKLFYRVNINLIWQCEAFFSTVDKINEQFQKVLDNDSNKDALSRDQFGSLAAEYGEEVPNFNSIQSELSFETIKKAEEELDTLNNGTVNKILSSYGYMLACRKFAKEGKIFECVRMLEYKMIQVDKVQPREFNFSVVIGALGRAGYAEKAFELYKKLRSYNLKPQLGTYTGLFNAVANSSNPDDLMRARNLYNKLKSNKNLLNSVTYNSIIKAFCRHSTSLQEPFQIFSDMLKAGKSPDDVTFLLLMEICGKDKKVGFRHALQVWRTMLTFGIEPTKQTLTTLLRICYQCQIGDPTLTTRSLLNSTEFPGQNFIEDNFRQVYWQKGQISTKKKEKVKMISDLEPMMLQSEDDKIEIAKSLKVFPNAASLFLTSGSLSQVEAVGECPNPWDRLQLLGGQEEIMKLIKEKKLKPNSQTFLWLLRCCKPETEAEMQIVKFYFHKSNRNILDVKFFNELMHQRLKRSDLVGFEKAFSYIASSNLKPDQYSILYKAKSISNHKQLLEFLEKYCKKSQDQPHQIQPNLEVYHQLIKTASRLRRKLKVPEKAFAIKYYSLIRILQVMSDNKIKLNKEVIMSLEETTKFPYNYNRWVNCEKKFENEIKSYQRFYSKWLQKMQMNSEEGENPFKKEKSPVETDEEI